MFFIIRGRNASLVIAWAMTVTFYRAMVKAMVRTSAALKLHYFSAFSNPQISTIFFFLMCEFIVPCNFILQLSMRVAMKLQKSSAGTLKKKKKLLQLELQ